VLQKKLMTREQLDQILRPEVLTKPHYSTVHKPIGEP
jgi:aspartate ammonia-lyase